MTRSKVVKEWTDNRDGYKLAILRIERDISTSYDFEHLPDYWYCVYVGVPEQKFFTGLGYDRLPVDCHGGLTFSGDDLKHVDEDGEKPVKWYGWDYNHAGDKGSETDVKELEKEAENVAQQFRELTAKDIVEARIRYMPDEVTDRVEIREVDSQ